MLVIRALLATLIMIALFFAGQPPAKAAIVIGGAPAADPTGEEPSGSTREIDWSLLLMFAGLFIIVAGAQHALLSPDIIAAVGRLHLDQRSGPDRRDRRALQPRQQCAGRAGAEAVCRLPRKIATRAWLVVAMASTLAGNFTVLGSIANLIVVQRAADPG